MNERISYCSKFSLSAREKKHVDSGLEDQLIESGVYDLGPTSAQRKGKSNNRGIRTHKLFLVVLFSLL